MAWAKQNGSTVAVIIPPGTYEIRQTISIGGSNVVLRGFGVSRQLQREERLHTWWTAPHGLHSAHAVFTLTSLHCPHLQVDQTTLYIPVGLQAVYGDAKNWAFQGGFIG